MLKTADNVKHLTLVIYVLNYLREEKCVEFIKLFTMSTIYVVVLSFLKIHVSLFTSRY